MQVNSRDVDSSNLLDDTREMQSDLIEFSFVEKIIPLQPPDPTQYETAEDSEIAEYDTEEDEKNRILNLRISEIQKRRL